jgi:hypothetical protein
VKIKSSLQKKIRAKKGEELIHIVCSDFQDTIGIAEGKALFAVRVYLSLQRKYAKFSRNVPGLY